MLTRDEIEGPFGVRWNLVDNSPVGTHRPMAGKLCDSHEALRLALAASQAEVDKARRERDDETAEVVQPTKERNDCIRLLRASNVDRLRIVGIFQEAIGAFVLHGLDLRKILGAELEEQVHGIVELEQPAKGETRDELRAALAASQAEVERLEKELAQHVAALDFEHRSANAALSAKEKAESDLCIALNDAKTIIARCDAATAALAERTAERDEQRKLFEASEEVRLQDNDRLCKEVESCRAFWVKRYNQQHDDLTAALDGLKRAREALGLTRRLLSCVHENAEDSPVGQAKRVIDATLSTAPPEAQGCDDITRVHNRKRSIREETEELREWLTSTPQCSGEWLRGSGGHREHGDCDRPATWSHPDDIWAYCDEHIKEHDKWMYVHRPEAQGCKRRKIVLCGSTKFKAAYGEWNARLTLEGNVVLSVAMWSHHDRLNPTAEQKALLDAVHLSKIDDADEVFVLDVGGYIGESTRNEIAYAEKTGKPVRYLSKQCPSWTEADCKWWQGVTQPTPPPARETTEGEVERIARIIRREVFGSPEYTDCLPELAAGYERAARTILAALGYEDSVERKAMLIRWCDDTSEAAREVYRNSARALAAQKEAP